MEKYLETLIIHKSVSLCQNTTIILIARLLVLIFSAMVMDADVYPVETVVRIKKTGEFAIIKDRAFLRDEKFFLNYRGIIEGRGSGLWAIYHDDIELECLPPGLTESSAIVI